MSLFFFCYTLGLICLCMISAAVCYSAYLVSRHRQYVLAMGMFLFYLFKIALIFQLEHLSQNVVFDSAQYFDIFHPVLGTVAATGFLTCLWLIVCDYFDERRPIVLIGPSAVFVAARLATFYLMAPGAWQQWAFYTLHQVYFALIAAFVLVRYLRAGDEYERLRLKRMRGWFIAFCAVAAMIVLEDTLVIFFLDATVLWGEFPLYLSERNFSDNVMLALVAVMAVREAGRTLSLRFEQAPRRRDEQAQKHIDAVMPAFCRQYGLSPRESEVLRLMLLGLDNRSIAECLTLAIGTVKAHVHNILKKTGQANREDLKRAFWQE